MGEQLYQKLAELFNRIGYGSRYCPELEALLKYLFSEEEARLTLNLSPFAPEPPAKVAERLGRDPERVAAVLNDMADKGLIYCSERGDEKWYKTIQLVPGIFELQFMKGEVTPRAKELARLFDAYFHAPREESDAGQDEGGISFARVIPIETTVSPRVDVFPYEEAGQYIDKAETITASICYCRHEQRLLGRGCDYPDDVCLQFGSFADFVRDRGFGREITREEAREIMKRSAEAGLVATSSNTRDRIDFICNCCTCCCGILRNVKNSGAPVRSVASNYLLHINEEECIACGDCVERCQMDAISLDDETAVVDTERCIGCGVCVLTCPGEALSLMPRPDFQEPPRSFRELIERQAAEKMRTGKL